MKFKEFLDEKLMLSQYRNYVKAWKQSGIARRYDSIFGSKDRIYEKFVPDQSISGFNQKELEKKIKEIESAINPNSIDKTYKIKDYKKGIVTNIKNKRDIKLVKVLDSFIKNYAVKAKENEEDLHLERYYERLFKWLNTLKKDFINDNFRTLKNDQIPYLICYSRHAYDIAGMSTDRGWSSCQDLDDTYLYKKPLTHFIEKDIKAGTIIAYFIKAEDKNLQHPIGRILLKPFYNNKEDVILITPSKYYGSVPSNFLESVQTWADKHFNKDKFGLFQADKDVFIEVDDVGRKIMRKNT